MSSSESGDDFESADEDFYFANTSKTEEDQNLTCEWNGPSGLGAKVVSKFEEAVCPVVSRDEENLNDSQLTEPSFNITKPLTDELKVSQKVALNSSEPIIDIPVFDTKNDERIDGSKIDQEKEDINLIKDDAIKTGQVEGSALKPKRVTKKLGFKLLKETKSVEVLDEKTPVNQQPETKSNSKPPKSEIDEHQLDKSKDLLDRNKCEESTTITQALDLISEEKLDSGWGDGWEIKEEDGFEIPVSKYTKHLDSCIQSAEEQSVKFPRPNEQQSQSWGGWSGWGVGSLISTATGSMSTFSTQVTAGLSTVIGAPDPQELAAAAVKREKEATELHSRDDSLPAASNLVAPYVGLGSLVSGVSSLGSSVIYRGLDTLENLGKKTMEVLQEGDPGLKKKRALLFPMEDKPVLSKILREAKEKVEHCDKEKEEKAIARRAHFESLFDDYQGMVHLEALEMLSTQCILKLQSMVAGEFGSGLQDFQETLTQVQALCELHDDDEDQPVLSPQEFADQVSKCIKGLNVTISPVKIIQMNDKIYCRLSDLCSGNEGPTVINQTAISSLAEFTAIAMECFHKSAELLLAKSIRNTPDEAESYVELTGHLCARVSAMAGEFTQLLTKNSPIMNSVIITNIFLEASNSCSYMKNACQLLVPILQEGAVRI